MQRLEEIASGVSGVQTGLEASRGKLVRSADTFRKNVRAKNAKSIGAGLYEEVADALFTLSVAENRMRQIETKNRSIADLINAINVLKMTQNNEATVRKFKKIVISEQVEEELAKLKSGSVRS